MAVCGRIGCRQHDIQVGGRSHYGRSEPVLHNGWALLLRCQSGQPIAPSQPRAVGGQATLLCEPPCVWGFSDVNPCADSAHNGIGGRRTGSVSHPGRSPVPCGRSADSAPKHCGQRSRRPGGRWRAGPGIQAMRIGEKMSLTPKYGMVFCTPWKARRWARGQAASEAVLSQGMPDEKAPRRHIATATPRPSPGERFAPATLSSEGRGGGGAGAATTLERSVHRDLRKRMGADTAARSAAQLLPRQAT
jgi:hypothetical protein